MPALGEAGLCRPDQFLNILAIDSRRGEPVKGALIKGDLVRLAECQAGGECFDLHNACPKSRTR